VLANFMAQGGDPTGSGRGGPGYQFEDEFDGGPALDARGLLAMANSGPGTNGSQFFITFVDVDNLTGLHTVFGRLVEGDDVLASVDLRDPDAPVSGGESIVSIRIIEN
jgi:cyclophilin family peptidyl-prolyl cis-trans isomerase